MICPMRNLLLTIMLFFSIASQAQTNDGNKLFDVAPEFPGGMQGVQEYLKITVRYPESARKANMEGRVLVKFDVDENGAVNTINVVKPIFPALDSEAVRVVKGMPNWKPATLNNKNVKVSMVLPIVFALTDAKTTK